MPGVVKKLSPCKFRRVVAEKAWQARQAAEKLKVSWTPGIPAPAIEFYEGLRKRLLARPKLLDSKYAADHRNRCHPKSTFYHASKCGSVEKLPLCRGRRAE
jgi:hypothetical protein